MVTSITPSQTVRDLTSEYAGDCQTTGAARKSIR
jgi:hypothetical protein